MNWNTDHRFPSVTFFWLPSEVLWLNTWNETPLDGPCQFYWSVSVLILAQSLKLGVLVIRYGLVFRLLYDLSQVWVGLDWHINIRRRTQTSKSVFMVLTCDNEWEFQNTISPRRSQSSRIPYSSKKTTKIPGQSDQCTKVTKPAIEQVLW